MTWDKVASFLTLTLVSFQGVLLLVVPEYRNRVYNTVAEGINSPTQQTKTPFLSSNPSPNTVASSSLRP